MLHKEEIVDVRKDDIDTDSNNEMQLEEQNKSPFITTFLQDKNPIQTNSNETEVAKTGSISSEDSLLNLANDESEEMMYS